MSETGTAPVYAADDVELSATGGPVADRRGQLSWALFEFSRSPYLSLVYIYVFATYFTGTVIGDPVRGQELWSLANTLVGVFVALLAPIMGAISDRMGRRKPWIAGIALIMGASCIALWWAMPGAEGGLPVPVILALIVVLATGFMCGEAFQNAMLPSIVSAKKLGGLSGLGIAVGNSGSLLALIVMLFGVALPASGLVDWGLLPDEPLFGLDPARHEHNRISGPVAGVWLLIFHLPLLLWTPDRPSLGVPMRRAIREGLREIAHTVKRAREIANVGLFLLARMLYTDGMVAILAYAGIYAAGTFGWDLAALLLFGVALTPFAIVGGLFGGWIDNRYGSRTAIMVSVGTTCIGMLAAVGITPTQLFYGVPYDAAAAGPVWSFPYFRTLPSCCSSPYSRAGRHRYRRLQQQSRDDGAHRAARALEPVLRDLRPVRHRHGLPRSRARCHLHPRVSQPARRIRLDRHPARRGPDADALGPRGTSRLKHGS